MHSKTKGDIGQAAVVYDLLKQNFKVFTEVGDLSRVDIIAEKDSKLYKIQVKSLTTNKNGSVCLKSEKSGPNYKFKYSKDDVDIFAIHSMETGELGYISSKEFLRNSTMNFRIKGAKNEQISKVRYLKEYKNVERALRDCMQPTQTDKAEGKETVQTTTSSDG